MIQNDFNSDDCPSLGDVFGGEAEDIEVDVGFIRECYFNQIFEQIKEYDVYRYILYMQMYIHCTCMYM